MRALAQYIRGDNFQTDIYAPDKLISPRNTETTEENTKIMADGIKFINETKDQPLNFAALDLEYTRSMLIKEASFANARNIRSKL